VIGNGQVIRDNDIKLLIEPMEKFLALSSATPDPRLAGPRVQVQRDLDEMRKFLKQSGAKQ